MKNTILSFLMILFVLPTSAQIGIKPLQSNQRLSSFSNANPDYQFESFTKLTKKAAGDTLQLPYFEEFTNTELYPDPAKWLDNKVYVNRHFGVDAPSYGVATFDELNEKGHPYYSMHNTAIVSADSLTSKWINLASHTANTIGPADSLYMSFFYQGKGMGEEIYFDDELLLFFLNKDGIWKEVWRASGKPMTEFEQVMIPITDSAYFYGGFQFRFKNISHRWGNNNHWHLDYIQIDKDRTGDDLYARDIAIQSEPSSLLKSYTSMPYAHFMVNPNSEMQDTVFLRVSNRDSIVKATQFKYIESHGANILANTVLTNNVLNTPAYGDTIRRAPLYDFSGLTGTKVEIKRQYIAKESGFTDEEPYNINDTLTTYQIFDNYYAKDDGSAEAGFGFVNLINAEGQMAVRFDLKKADTLRGVGFFFTQLNKDVSGERFTVRVWRSIDLGGGVDSILYEEFRSRPSYTDSINGFHIYEFDSAIIMDPGVFYVGWTQDSDFSLNVGLDKNSGNIAGRTRSANPDIFYNTGLGWFQNNNANLYGSPMIRAYVGRSLSPVASVQKVQLNTVTIYPNPSSGVFNLNSAEIEQVEIYDTKGMLIRELEVENESIDLSELRNGRYLLRWYNDNYTKTGYNWINIFH